MALDSTLRYSGEVKYMGIDYGEKRVGLALSNESNEFSLPFKVLPNNKILLQEIQKICVEKNVTDVVVGESKDFHGNKNPIMERISIFVSELEKTSGVKVHLEPEFLTSHQAQHIQGKTDMIDASAAAIILKSFLERNNNVSV